MTTKSFIKKWLIICGVITATCGAGAALWGFCFFIPQKVAQLDQHEEALKKIAPKLDAIEANTSETKGAVEALIRILQNKETGKLAKQ